MQTYRCIVGGSCGGTEVVDKDTSDLSRAESHALRHEPWLYELDWMPREALRSREFWLFSANGVRRGQVSLKPT